MMRTHALLVTTLLGAGLTAAPAGATTLSGLTRLAPSGSAASALGRQSIRIVPGGAADSATTAGLTTVLFPAGEATFGTTTRLRLGGSLALRRTASGRTRTVRLRSLQLRLGARSRALSAVVGGRRLDVFRLDLRAGEYTADAATTVVRIEGARAELTVAAARAIARGLGVRRVRTGTFGVVATSASAPVVAAGSGGTPVSGGGSTGAGTGSATPTSAAGSTFTPPVPLARPATAVDIAGSELRWRLRESFVRYVKSGEGVTADAGATLGPAAADGNAYDVDFTPAGGWYDPASGAARLLFRGRVAFSYAGHGIDIRFADPQVELTGDRSRVLATFASAKASGFTGLGEFVALDPAAASTAGSAGPLVAYSALPARITPWANEAVMSGFYPAPDDAFGALTLRYTRGA